MGKTLYNLGYGKQIYIYIYIFLHSKKETVHHCNLSNFINRYARLHHYYWTQKKFSLLLPIQEDENIRTGKLMTKILPPHFYHFE